MSARPGWSGPQARHARSLIEKLLVADITFNERMGISDLLNHKWFASFKYGVMERPNVLELIITRDSLPRQQ